MKPAISALFAGLLMGSGFVVSGMTDPDKVLNFLDIFGQWDPTLITVMAAAVMINMPASWKILKSRKPILTERFHLPVKQKIDRPLIIGAVVFGIGWGLAGICPGPGLARILTGDIGVLPFIAAMLAGFCLEPLAKKAFRLFRWQPKSA